MTRLTIHHFPDPRRVMDEVARVTRPNGRVVVVDFLSSEKEGEASLHNALETLRDPTHMGALSANELQKLLQASGLRITSRVAWERERDFEEWIGIANAPERAKPIYTVMATLAGAGIQAGIDLHLDGNKVTFKHDYLLLAAEK